MLNPEFWKGKRVLVTGHTGFKGAWVSMWLHRLGAVVTGYSLEPPSDPNLFEKARIPELIDSHHGDVRDLPGVEAVLALSKAEIVLHMAAQSLVRYSYDHPVETFSTNVLGTVHVLDAVRRAPSVKAVVVVTSDKCYRNNEWDWGYRENEPFGGDDPYSGSKGCTEVAVAAYQHSFFNKERNPGAAVVATARAGNVIGGGDWSLDRLVPDILRSLLKGEPTVIRNPHAMRPWQHVLEPLHGYLMLAERLHEHGHAFSSGWNFGPSEEGERSVGWIVERLYELWKVDFEWKRDAHRGPPESTLLKLDSSKARTHLGWRPKLDLGTTLQWIVDWTRQFEAGKDLRAVSQAEIDKFMAIVPKS